jgi:hypothetical protein
MRRFLFAFDSDSMTDLVGGFQSQMSDRHGIELVEDMLWKRSGSASVQIHMQRELL